MSGPLPCSLDCHKKFWNLLSYKYILSLPLQLPCILGFPKPLQDQPGAVRRPRQLLWGSVIAPKAWLRGTWQWVISVTRSVCYQKSHLLGTCHKDHPWFQSQVVIPGAKTLFEMSYKFICINLSLCLLVFSSWVPRPQLSTSTQLGAVSPHLRCHPSWLFELDDSPCPDIAGSQAYALSDSLGLPLTSYFTKSQLLLCLCLTSPQTPFHPIQCINHLLSTHWGHTLG